MGGVVNNVNVLPTEGEAKVSDKPLSGASGTNTDTSNNAGNTGSGSSTPATIQTTGQGQSSTQAAQSQQPKQSNKPASSGMFTNIQNYVQKNQPAAQKMAGAVSQNVGNQASEIRQVAEQKKAQTDAALAANQKNIEESKNWATTQIGNVMGTNTPPPVEPPTPTVSAQSTLDQETPPVTVEEPPKPAIYEMSEEDIKRMQDLTEGKISGITQVGDLNLSQQQMRAQALQQLAQGANTEQGRQNLLRQTFQGQAPNAYTRGLSGLDQLIVSGDQTAREQLVTGTQAQAQGLGQDLGNLQQQAYGARMEQLKQLADFSPELEAKINRELYGEGEGEDRYLGIQGEIDKYLVDEKNEREKLWKAASDFEQNLKNRINLLRSVYSSPDAHRQLDISRFLMNHNNWYSGNITDAFRDYHNIDPNIKTYEDLRNSARLTQDDITRLGIDPSSLPSFMSDMGFSNYNKLAGTHRGSIADIGKALSNLTVDPVTTELSKMGYSPEQIANMSDLTRANVATPEQIARYNMLNKFLNKEKEEMIAPEQKDNYLSSLALKNLLEKYSTTPSGSSGGGPRGTT